jgi:phage recombination protein Bet
MTTATTTALATRETRLPRPAGVDPSHWQILCEVIFPHVRNQRSIVLAVEYCKARKLDIMKRPVNIVPMWSSELRKEVDTIWPSINETQITAARSGEWAGMDAPEYGEMKTQTFTGTRKDKDGSYVDAKVTVTFPESAAVTVYRLKQGERYPFTERVFWLEAYGRSGGSQMPNATWIKRPIGQLTKVAKAAALRAAFPEEDSSPTDEEMRGGMIDDDMPDHEAAAPQRPAIATVPKAAPATKDALDELLAGQDEPIALVKTIDDNWPDWGARLMAKVRACSDSETVDAWAETNKEILAAMQTEMPKMYSGLLHSINKHKLTLISDQGEQ